ncbi:Bacteriophage P2-related tail formation protein [Pseudomonas syringae pv. actinidiae]|uniref:Bacteriophage P2-related tail formation protein n=3 Tax=Pseudomonas syringae group TaxID=136849 RepID=A0A2V0QJL8_PSESF|nr:Bacteriophage P2-related tail formation protein [Pseudomonas syringae pv. actinidiae]
MIISGTSRHKRFAKVVMFIRLSRILMGKHALAGKTEQTGEAKAPRYGSWRQAVTLADKVACSTHDLVGSYLQRLPCWQSCAACDCISPSTVAGGRLSKTY